MSEIKQEVLDLATLLKKGIKIEKDGNTVVEEGLYEKNLPGTISMDTLKEVQKFNNTFIAAAAHAFGDEAIAAMKKNAELSQISVQIPTVGKDNLNLSFQRERTIPSTNGEGASTVKYGSLQAKYDMYGTGSRGQLLKVKQDLSDRATAAFGG